MGDSVSESSRASSWTRDEFEYVDEVRLGLGKKESSKDSLVSTDNEEAVSAAVSLVVGSLRHGVVSLCASVAHILRENTKLQQRLTDLEKHRLNLENNISGTASVNGSCSVHSQSPNLQESLVTQRCGSAPASFIASGLKFLRSDYQSNVTSAQDGGSRHCDGNSDCRAVREPGKGECRTSSISMPEAHSSLVPKLINNDKKTSFSRGSVQASTRSLNICQSLPASSFVRRKYSTISLRRVRRSTTNRQKASSICSTSSIYSYMSCTNSDEHRRSSNNSSCIITVAEIHTPPGQRVAENKEGEAVKLLARTLTSVLQSDVNNQDASRNESEMDEVNCPSASGFNNSNKELSLPHPLAGCECVICCHLTADPTCQLYALTTEGGSLLPPGSTILVEGERVGTVLYLGHERYVTFNQSAVSPIAVEALLAHAGYMRPVGITMKLWAPDHGEIFVPLSAVICQLDENLDLPRKESWSSFEYEYVDEDSDEELHSELQNNVYSKEGISSGLCVQSNEPLDMSPKVKNTVNRNEELPYDHYFSRSPSVSSCCSVISHSLGDLSVYGLECEDVEFDKELTCCIDDSTSSDCIDSTGDLGTECIPGKFTDAKEILSSQESILNTTFTKKATDEDSNEIQGFHGSLYDTCDSAISLSFTRRHQYSEDNSGPSSVTETGRESPHFGDTWDSGCSVGRSRCRSGSSGHCSDSESENHRLGHTFARSLGDALNMVLEKHNIQRNWDFENDMNGEGNTNMNVNTDLSRNCEKSERVQELQDFSLDTSSLSSPKLQIRESIPGQSEV
ncbi:serine-rich adhesin for platelets-like [Macrobrachium rosenbergii]|uniref:serine-rich adhesin for platelets-like n=1 Tax=Macrobrachium rosenbergii TaxID=79674 RepID=UPI0034D58493